MKHPGIVSTVASVGALLAILSLPPATANGQAGADNKATANARPRGAPFPRQLTLFDRQGKVVRTVGEPGNFNQPVLSPDGTRLAVVKQKLGPPPNTDIWVFDLATGKSTQVTSDPTLRQPAPVWSPDGSQIAYFSFRERYGGLYRKASNGTGSEELLYRHTLGAGMTLTDWSPDGRFLSFFSGGVLYALPLDGDQKSIELPRTEFDQQDGCFAPDPRFLAYRSDESGRFEVYVRTFDPSSAGSSPAGKWQISNQGGLGLVQWGRDGRELYYLAGDGGVMAVDVTTTPAFKAGMPKLLFRAPGTIPLTTGTPGGLGSISRDGQRIVFAVPMPPERKAVTVAPEILAKYTGTYVLFGTDAVFTLEDNQLMAQWGQDPKVPLSAESETNFFSNVTNGELEFIKDDQGRVTHFLFYEGGRPTTKAPRK